MNSSLKIIPITTSSQKKQFIHLPYHLYRHHPIWTPPLIIEEKKLIDIKKRPFYRHAKLQLFLAIHRGKVVGRIGSLVNRLYNEYHKINHGFFGFFHSINNSEVAIKLINAAISWLTTFKVTKMIGPFNPSFFDTMGILIKGFDRPHKILLPYNYDYYDSLLTNAGLSKELDLYGYTLHKDMPSIEKNIKRTKNIIDKRLKKNGFSIRLLNLKQIKNEINTVISIFNTAWSKNWGFTPLQKYEAEALTKELKLVLNPNFCFFVTHNGKDIGCLFNLPNINPILKTMNGRLFPTGLFKLLYHKNKVDEYRVALTGILPQYHRRGLEGLMFHFLSTQFEKFNINTAETTWIAETNKNALLTISRWSNLQEPNTIYRVYQRTL